jgi:hypothetical protein
MYGAVGGMVQAIEQAVSNLNWVFSSIQWWKTTTKKYAAKRNVQ